MYPGNCISPLLFCCCSFLCLFVGRGVILINKLFLQAAVPLVCITYFKGNRAFPFCGKKKVMDKKKINLPEF